MNLSGFSNAGIEKRQKLETREEMRHGVQRPLLCRSTDLDGTPSWRQAIGGSVRPDWKRVPQRNQRGQSGNVTFGAPEWHGKRLAVDWRHRQIPWAFKFNTLPAIAMLCSAYDNNRSCRPYRHRRAVGRQPALGCAARAFESACRQGGAVGGSADGYLPLVLLEIHQWQLGLEGYIQPAAGKSSRELAFDGSVGRVACRRSSGLCRNWDDARTHGASRETP